MSNPEKIYGVADKAWQIVVGCDPHMKCAPRCWARKTVARVVECQKPQHPERARLFQIALTPDGKQWSGNVFLDDAHLTDPLRWRKPALIATGFHGDWGRLQPNDMLAILQQVGKCPQHRFLLLSKQPDRVFEFLWDRRWINLERTGKHQDFLNASLGFSIMDQADADRMRAYVKMLDALGWATHVWHEPAIGPVNWRGWEFLRGMIMGYESGSQARPGHPQWARDTRDWCVAHGVPFNFKQWGEWAEHPGKPVAGTNNGAGVYVLPNGRLGCQGDYWARVAAGMDRVGKRNSGRLLDGRTWDEVPAFHAADAAASAGRAAQCVEARP